MCSLTSFRSAGFDGTVCQNQIVIRNVVDASETVDIESEGLMKSVDISLICGHFIPSGNDCGVVNYDSRRNDAVKQRR